MAEKKRSKRKENNNSEVKKEKSRASRIIDGEIEPEENERGLLNLRKRKPFNEWDKDELHAVAVKGGEAVQVLHGEKKSAKQAIEKVLTLKITDEIAANADADPKIIERLRRDNPNATLYDLVQAVAVGKALEGNIKAAEYVRDTHGDKPIEKVELTENVTTEQDRELMRQIAERLNDPTITIEATKRITTDDGEQ